MLSKYSFAVLVLACLIFAVQAEWVQGIIAGCDGSNITTYNATGGTTKTGVLGLDKKAELKYRTGFAASPKLQKLAQYFWVDTSGTENLNKASFNSVVTLFFNLPQDVIDKADDDDGSCETMIGQECLGAITTSVDANGNATFFDESNYNSLSECNLGSSMMTTLATTDPAMSGAANCGPTNTDNDKGQSSLLFTFVNASSDANADDFAPYDLMAKKAYFMSVVEWRANDTGKGGKQAYFVCLKNTDFSEGARNPEPAQNQPPSQPSGSVSPTPTPPKGSAITFTASGMVWAAAMGAFLVFV